jgi:hypothetical protein
MALSIKTPRHPVIQDRIGLINHLLKARKQSAYLEIGVRRGDCFCNISSNYKVAVDPKFQIKRHLYWLWRNLFSAQYFECTSDDFFAEKINKCRTAQFDVIFIDGLHTYHQTLLDVQHSLEHLKPDGCILLHDCNPPCEMAAVPAASYLDALKKFGLKESHGAWNGDVWKTIVHLRSTMQNLQITVLDCDEGIGLIRRGVPENPLHYSVDQIEAMTYADLNRNRVQLLKLKSPKDVALILS